MNGKGVALIVRRCMGSWLYDSAVEAETPELAASRYQVRRNNGAMVHELTIEMPCNSTP